MHPLVGQKGHRKSGGTAYLIRAAVASGVLPGTKSSGRVFPEGPMPGQVVCVQCDKTEEHCACEKYCTICQGQVGVRLCMDGLYYCPDCREACDVSLADDRAR